MRPSLVKKMGATTLYFINENFEKQGFQGATFEPWAKRNPDKDPGRPVLQGKGTAHLKRSPFVSYSDAEKAIITSSLPYSKIHNEGGEIFHPAREAYMHFDKTPEHGLWRLGKIQTVKQVEHIKATIPVNIGAHSTKMKKRQFMGRSPVLTLRIREMLRTEVAKAFHIIK
jgi:phage gpG-like protein